MPATANAHQIVLASGSRARREMLAAAGVPFTVLPADVDEPAIRDRLFRENPSITPQHIAEVLATAKAEEVSARCPGAFVIGADQVLALGVELLSKAPNMDLARETLKRLRGRSHVLHSAVVFAENGKVTWRHVGAARLTMRNFSDPFLEDYLLRAGEKVMQSVGGYELEGQGVQLFERIDGDYFTILGLPLLEVLAELRGRGKLEA